MKKIITILKYTFVLTILFLFATKKPNQVQIFHSVKFPDDAFASQSDDGQVYNLDIKDLEKVQDQAQTINGVADIKGFPENILRLDGKKVKVTGYLLIPSNAYLVGDSLDNFGVGKNAYGCPCCDWSSSPPPTLFNVIFVTMKNGQKLGPPFSPLVEVTGTFHARQEYFTDEDGKKRLSGLFFINDAEAIKRKQGFLKGILG
jgi:hypothetical protein